MYHYINYSVFIYRDYAVLVAMFFCANVCNNYAFNFNIPMPLHMIFRAVSIPPNNKYILWYSSLLAYRFVADKIACSHHMHMNTGAVLSYLLAAVGVSMAAIVVLLYHNESITQNK